MKKIIDLITEQFINAFSECGYETAYAKVTISNRPDLCEYQCNGAMAAAKQYKKAPITIANDIVGKLEGNSMFQMITAVNPGFINFNLNPEFLMNYVSEMAQAGFLGCEQTKSTKKIIIDYGGANVAKPLHVGHLRSAVIGEAIKRMNRFVGNDVTGDAHLGDWGLQMGLIITELKLRKPELVYFDENYVGEYPTEAPFTMVELEEIYPCANAKSKVDETFKETARLATFELQNGNKGYLALWQHILNVSIPDLKKNYDNLNVSFELWKKESDAQPYIPEMVRYMKDQGFTRISEGALVVDVKEDTDTKEIPPCMILKSNGATLYNTTDLATIVERMKLFQPDHIVYVVDKRQELYFEQVFRCARKTGLVQPDTELTFLGFGTMNGKDGKPFKTRDGGVMRLENLIREINEAVYNKIMENRSVSEEEAKETAKIVGLSALKYGDLSNQASKDYIFDVERFTSFEGNTGPYILYTIVRIKSILGKYYENNDEIIDQKEVCTAESDCEKSLMLTLARFNDMIENAVEEFAPHKICAYVYELANEFNKFYHETKILTEENQDKKKGYIALITLTKAVLEQSIDILGFEAPDRM
ncbi:MAG: arginine--tRNA ligase [Lachnospiraceae bacterium]|nr:arginine--tRNA ligase [Lachnospiraceae bacterium]